MGSKIICHENNFITVPDGTEFIMNINDIVIPNLFKNSPPNPKKTEPVRDFILKNSFVDSPILIEGNLLTDGYSRYVVCKELGIEYIPVTTGKVKKTNKLPKNRNNDIIIKNASKKFVDIYRNGFDCVIYTDGSYNSETHEYCSAYIVVKNREIIHKDYLIAKDEIKLDSNIAESQALLLAVKYAQESNLKICICSDSLVAINWVIGENKEPKKRSHKEWYNAFMDFMNSMKDCYKLQKVKGHSNDWYNIYVDRFAKRCLKNSFQIV